MACCSNQCERRHKCALYIGNPRDTNGIEFVESWYTHGWGSISVDRCESHYDCGPLGNCGMFTPISVEPLKRQIEALQKTIKELERGEFD